MTYYVSSMDSMDSMDFVELTKRKLRSRSESSPLSMNSYSNDSLKLTKRRMSRSTENSDEKDTVPLQAAEKPAIAEDEASHAKANPRRVATPDIPSIRPLTITNSAA
jgi:hypothetical protein